MCTMSNVEASSESVQTQTQEYVAHILIRRAASLDSFEKLTEADSVESSLARSRGGGSVIEGPDSDDEESHMVLSEGKISIESGYVMQFVDQSERHLNVYDITALPEKTAYPVSQKTLNSLDQWALSKLHSDGHVKLTGVYDQESKEFQDVQQGWTDYQNPYDRLVELSKKADGDMISAAYYLISEHASDQYAHPDSIANIRDIEPTSVKNAIRRVQNLDQDGSTDEL